MFVDLVLWLRQIFCDHQFKYEDVEQIRRSEYYPYQVAEQYTKVYMHCPLCGYHKTYRK